MDANLKIIIVIDSSLGIGCKNSVAQSKYSELDIDAIAIYGGSKSVTKITGNLPALR